VSTGVSRVRIDAARTIRSGGMRRGMLSEERRRAILQMVQTSGRVVVKDLSRHFQTTQVTIRKDLETLHSQGLVHRTHGGALTVTNGALLDRSLTEKEKLHRKEKSRIAHAAVRLVQEGQSVVLDSGSTTTMIARALRQFRNLTVITNALNIAAELADSNVEVVLVGGVLRKESASLVGPFAEETLRRLSPDILFLGVDGFDVGFGLSTPNPQEAHVNSLMVEAASRTVVVCDSSKFRRRSLCLIAPTSAAHQVITDSGISKSDRERLEKAGIELTVV
jgi:DeoR family transcriptional regulator, aga operon transcriptional repressor